MQSCPFKISVKKKNFLSEPGNIVSHKTGVSSNFKGYRHYVFGDDLRSLDWNVYARTNELYLKEFFGEEKNTFLILIDNSESMRFGMPQKNHYSMKIAAGTSFLGIHSGATVRIAIIEDNRLIVSKSFENPRNFYEVLHFLSWRKTKGTFSLGKNILNLLISSPKSFVFLCSDLFFADKIKKSLHQFIVSGHELAIFHLLSDEEQHPLLNGNIELEDAEDHTKAMLKITPEVIYEYNDILSKFKANWLHFCQNHGIYYSFNSTTDDILHILYRGLSFVI